VVLRERTRSSVLNEADLLSILSESLSAHHDVVLSDETKVAASDAAAATVLTELAGVRLQLVWH
jgi:hypothetical protein